MYDVTTAKLFLLDMDGTFYLDDTLLPGALEFLALCRATGRQFAFLTNNSSKSKADYLAKLTRLGADVTEHDIFTSGDATLLYLAENGFSKDILLIGHAQSGGAVRGGRLHSAAAKPRAVVLGFDTTITYNKLRLLCDAVRAGLPYIATHPDYNCPVAGGFIPDIGAVIAFVKASTGRDPDAVIGKPNAYIARAAAHKYGVSLEDVCMVGDRLYTDIALGAAAAAPRWCCAVKQRRRLWPQAASRPASCAPIWPRWADCCSRCGPIYHREDCCHGIRAAHRRTHRAPAHGKASYTGTACPGGRRARATRSPAGKPAAGCRAELS